MPFNFIISISNTLIGISVAVFVFAVTLLGDAIERARKEESKAKDAERKEYELKINNLENKIKLAKESGDPKSLKIELQVLLKNKENFEDLLKKIQHKYSLLTFKKCVIFPVAFFIIAILLSEIGNIYQINYISFLAWLLSLFSIVVGSKRISESLILVEEISSTSEEVKHGKLIMAFKSALTAHEKDKEIELTLSFRDIEFPHECDKNSEITIKFGVELQKGNFAKNAKVYFYIPDGFVLINPPELKSWRQNSKFVVPNIRTIKNELGDINVGLITRSFITINAPDSNGEYFVFYTLLADGYCSEKKKIGIKTK